MAEVPASGEQAEEPPVQGMAQKGVVSTLLSDGGSAILGAIDAINEQRQSVGKRAITKRRCFAHNTRMPLSKGGGKRGGKGSFCRYLLDHGCPAKVMAKIMDKIFKFNYLPCAETFKVATNLLISEYKEHLNEHVLAEYLDPNNPNKIGGRAANQFQGQNGSTQGVERRGGNIKKKITSRLKRLPGSEQTNPIHIMLAVGDDKFFRFSKGTETCASIPEEKPGDMNFIKSLANWKEGQAITSDIRFMLFRDSETRPVNSNACIGVKEATFTAYIPTMSNVYTTLREMRLADQLLAAGESLAAQNLSGNVDYNSKEVDFWRREYSQLSEGDKVQLKTLLASKFAEHTIASKPGESCYDYLLRHCQRFPKKDRGDLLKSGFGVKKLSTLKSEKRQLDDEKKWAVQPQSKKNRGKKGKKTKGINESVEPQPHNFELGSSLEDLGVSIDVDVGDDLDIEDLWGVLNLLDSDMFDMKEVATLKLANRDARVSLNGELGDWIKIEVKGSSVSEGADSDGTMSVRCNCNRCNFDGSCQFVTTFNAIQFGKVPRCLGAEDAFSWTAQVARAGRIANRLNIDVCTPASK